MSCYSILLMTLVATAYVAAVSEPITAAVEPANNVISVGEWVTVGDSSQPGWRHNTQSPM